MNYIITLKIEGVDDDTKAGVSMISDIEFTPADIKVVTNNLADLICLPQFKKED